jgi:hypothetical protein
MKQISAVLEEDVERLEKRKFIWEESEIDAIIMFEIKMLIG